MLERRLIRVLVPYSRTLYYNDKGRERGITAELVRDFEQWINKKYAKKLGKRPVTVYVSPTTRDELIDDVAEGLGDIAAGNLSVTPKRLEKLDFYAPQDLAATKEVLVTGPTAPALGVLDDLAGKTVHVRPVVELSREPRGALNQKLKAAGRPLVRVVALPDALEDEDVMEMINAGILAVIGGRRVEGQDLGADPAEAQAARRPGAARRRAHRLGVPQGQPEAARRAGGLLHQPRQEAGRDGLPPQAADAERQAAQDPTQSAEYKRYAETIALFQKYGRSTASTR